MAGTVLVTGGLGFIGSHVIRELLEEGRRVIVIDREAEGNVADEVLSVAQRASVPLVARAIPGTRTLTGLLREHSVEGVIHLASPLATMTEVQPELIVHDMIAPHLAILDACCRSGVRRLVWASSVGVFGRSQDYTEVPIPNDAPHRPLTLYGAAKSLLEYLSSSYTAQYGLDTVALRFPLVYGPGRRRGGGQFTTELIEGAALGRKCVVDRSDGRSDWMYVGDAARSAVMALHASSVTSRAMTVCGQVATRREVAQMLSTFFPEAEIVMLPGTIDLVAEYDATTAFEQIGFKPVRTLREGVRATANAARQRAGLPPVS